MRWLPALGLLLLASAAFAGGEVHTSRPGARVLPLPEEEGVFHFLVFGDRTGGPPEGLRVLAQAVRDANLLGPDLVMTVGDLVQGYNETAEWTAQMEEFRKVMSGLRMPWFPVAGNHDVYWAGRQPPPPGHHEADFERHFGPLWYWFGHKEAAFVVLYSDEGDREGNRKGWDGPDVNRFSREQMAWLRDALKETRSYRHVFVFLHHPRWIADAYPGSNWDKVHGLLRGAGNVTAVFAGHIHRQRYDGVRDGIEYFTLATTGGATPMDAPGTTFLHHANLVTVRASGITVATLPVGSVLDPRDMTPERWAEVDLLRALAPVHEDSLTLAPDGSGSGAYRLRVPNPSKRPTYVTFEVETGEDGTWWFAPDHRHALIPPGREQEVAFRWRRVPDGPETDLATLEVPRITLQIDYLTDSLRVALPARPVACRIAIPELGEPATPPVPEVALELEGSACLEVPGPEMALPDGPFTAEAWLRGRTFEGRRGLLCKTESSDYGIFVSDGVPEFSVFLGRRYATATPGRPLLEPGRWHHVAGVFDGAEVRLYVDGKRVAAVPGAGARRTNLLPFLVGADPDKGGRPMSGFEGLVDEVRVSRGARYDADFEPARRFAPDAETFLLLHLDRAIGPLAPDSSPGKRHALSHGAVRYATVR